MSALVVKPMKRCTLGTSQPLVSPTSNSLELLVGEGLRNLELKISLLYKLETNQVCELLLLTEDYLQVSLSKQLQYLQSVWNGSQLV